MADGVDERIVKQPDEQQAEQKDEHHNEHKDQSRGKGIVQDFRQTIGTHWKAEILFFNQKIIAVSFFLFFACVAPAITFGAIYSKITHNHIGAVETILATAWSGIVYALFGGMPVMINGPIGPVLVFDGVLYKISESLDVPFLTFHAWVGIWVFIYSVLAGYFDLNRLMHYATRFTDEIFELLICSIYIVDAFGNPFDKVGIYYYFVPPAEAGSKESSSYMSQALLSVILCIGTCWLAFVLRGIKHSPFCPNKAVRTVITDFGVVTSILTFSVIGNMLFSDVGTETLDAPDTFAPTYLCCTSDCRTSFPSECLDIEKPYGRRPWLVNLGDLNGKWWIPIMSAVPAILAYVLIFLNNGITWHLINHPSHKMAHGTAYNYDTVLIGLLTAVNSMFGLPWIVAATVRALQHLHSLASKDKNGKFIKVHENRLTNLFIHTLVMVSLFALNVLRLIPMPVLYGVFLFMGLAPLSTTQFFNRMTMLFMEPSQYPKQPFTEHVRPGKMHLFTFIQLASFMLLYGVKSYKKIAIVFPLVLAACIPFRLYVLPKIFSRDELLLLDGDEEGINMWFQTKEKPEDIEALNLDDESDCVEVDMDDCKGMRGRLDTFISSEGSGHGSQSSISSDASD